MGVVLEWQGEREIFYLLRWQQVHQGNRMELWISEIRTWFCVSKSEARIRATGWGLHKMIWSNTALGTQGKSVVLWDPVWICQEYCGCYLPKCGIRPKPYMMCFLDIWWDQLLKWPECKFSSPQLLHGMIAPSPTTLFIKGTWCNSCSSLCSRLQSPTSPQAYTNKPVRVGFRVLPTFHSASIASHGLCLFTLFQNAAPIWAFMLSGIL